MSFGVCWFLLVSVVVLNCPEIPVRGDYELMGEVYVCLWGLDVGEGVLECSGLHAADTLETFKYHYP